MKIIGYVVETATFIYGPFPDGAAVIAWLEEHHQSVVRPAIRPLYEPRLAAPLPIKRMADISARSMSGSHFSDWMA